MPQTEKLPSEYSKAFTLVELSLVLVVVAFLIAGVLVGQSLIRAAEINSITTELESFKSAVDIFNKKYNALPGDMYNAQDYWEAAADCTSAQTDIATCNGDGDGFVETLTPSGTVGNESFLFWKHLANAELIKGNYTGIKDGVGSTAATNYTNSPSGKADRSLWYINYLGTNPLDGFSFNAVWNNTLFFGRYKGNTVPRNGVLTADEASALDTKFDDGKPGTGSMMVEINSGSIYCAAKSDGSFILPANTSIAVYNISVAGKNCVLRFPRIF